MKKYLVLMLALSTLVPFMGMAKDMGGGEAPSQEEMMARWQAAATPGEHHKVLDFFVGEWDYTFKAWMGGQGAPPMEAKGTASAKWIMDGRYVEMVTSGDFMGATMTGRSCFGYDNYRMQYIGTWMDNMSTSPQMYVGNFDKMNRVFRFAGDMDEPMTGEIGKPIWAYYRLKGEDMYVMEAHDPVYPEGKTKVMEITYTRKK